MSKMDTPAKHGYTCQTWIHLSNMVTRVWWIDERSSGRPPCPLRNTCSSTERGREHLRDIPYDVTQTLIPIYKQIQKGHASSKDCQSTSCIDMHCIGIKKKTELDTHVYIIKQLVTHSMIAAMYLLVTYDVTCSLLQRYALNRNFYETILLDSSSKLYSFVKGLLICSE